MKVKLYGTRGSIPVCEPQFQKYGGNTTCILIQHEGKNLILDAGTGIRALGKELHECDNCENLFIGFSHFHWDHIQGFPFFLPAYDQRRKLTITTISKEKKYRNLKTIFKTQMRTEYFPIPLESMGAKLNFQYEANDIFELNDIVIKTADHNHPGGALSYRIEAGGKSVVFCTDVEHGTSLDKRVLKLADGADLLIHEGMYTDDELKGRKGWGHSSWQQAVQVAKEAGVSKLIITHHDPDHDDNFLDQVENECKNMFEDVFLAYDKMEVIL